MANHPATDHEYRYKITGGEFTNWTPCTSNVITLPNEDIAIGDLQVRVKAIGLNPASIILSNSQAFTSSISPVEPIEPSDIEGLFGWFDATDENGVTVVSDKATQFIDKSGEGNTMVGAYFKPNYVASGGLNNLPYINVDSGQTMKFDLASEKNTPFTVYLLIRQNDVHHNSAIFQWGDNYLYAIAQFSYGGTSNLFITNGVATVYNLKQSYNNKFSLYRFSVTDGAVGLAIESIDKQPVITGSETGNASMTRLQLGGNVSNFDVHEILLLDNLPSSETDERIRQYFFNKYAMTDLVPQYVPFGDSITYGNNSSNNATKSYVSLVSLAMQWTDVNRGVPGSDIGYVSPTGNDLMDLYTTQEVNSDSIMSFCYGTNSVGLAYNIAWKNDYKTAISHFIDKGVKKENIYILTPPYQSNKAVAMTPFLQAISDIASELEINLVDAWSYTLANGGDSLLADGTHPNDAGHQVIADFFLDVINS